MKVRWIRYLFGIDQLGRQRVKVYLKERHPRIIMVRNSANATTRERSLGDTAVPSRQPSLALQSAANSKATSRPIK